MGDANTRIESQPSFVLRTRSYLETSLIVDVFSRDFGRLSLVAKGARGGRSSKARRLQPFSELSLNWQGRSDLKTLTAIDAAGPLLFNPERLVSGMYLNELVFFLVTEMDPHPGLYQLYAQTLGLLNDSPNIETVLRNFEFGLLDELGYAVNFLEDHQGHSLKPDTGYFYYADSGFVNAEDQRSSAIPGQAILELAQQGLSTELALKAAKAICRAHIDLLLNGRELQSRKWYRKPGSSQASQLSKQQDKME